MSQPELNNPRAAFGAVRQPRPLVTLNGTLLTGVLEIEVTNASHFTADTFRVVAASNGLPPAYGPAYWAASAEDQVAVSAGFTDSLGNLTSTQLILGQVDNIDYDPVRRLLVLEGRDLSAPLIDNKTTEKFQNLTASQIAQKLALRRGLDSSVQATTTKAGTYYALDHVVLTQEQTEWDLLIYLAQREGFDVWVSGKTLYFQPSPVTTAPPYVLLWSDAPDSNMVDVRLQRSETLARDVVVKVRTWNQIQQKAFTVTCKVSTGSNRKTQTYSFIVPNLTRDEARKLAQAKAEEISRHERVLHAHLPGDNLLTTRAMVRLIGTNTAWDQDYYPDAVTRRLSVEEGYRMELRAKNHSTQSTAILG